ncbi:hypothetical protein E0H73_41335 [Kribbella pittospori]|uniref:Uncharacterized protein n=1 Tax=Kribbella pittospori TaxID=722689 RepID=A0A4R0JSX7_9ACTN|nr:hypothetical protein [Kribbella pittospori]TCC50511.1 hypothetical protein E0H73_41335 [Kribbella pittospori]
MTDHGQSEAVPDAAALVIRVWREPTDETGMRARITQRPDLAADAETTAVVTSPEAVYREVRAWLEEFVGRTASQS